MDTTDFTFRRLAEADRADILAISAKVWDGDDYLPASLDDWLSDGEGVFNGCFVDDRLIGFGRVGFIAPGHAWLEGLRKDLDCGLRGVGRALCLEGLRFLSAIEGLLSVRFSAYAHNPETIALNEGIGFRRLAAYSIKSKRLPGDPQGKPAFGAALERPAVGSYRVMPSGESFARAAAVERLRERGWLSGFRLESWKAYPLDATPALRGGDIVIEAGGGLALGSLDPLKRQANVVAFDAKDQATARLVLGAFESVIAEAGYTYIEAVTHRDPRLLALLDACGYESWESEDDFLLYEWPPERLGELAEVAARWR